MSRKAVERVVPDFSLEVSEEEAAEWHAQNPPEHSWWDWLAERWSKPELPPRPFPASIRGKE